VRQQVGRMHLDRDLSMGVRKRPIRGSVGYDLASKVHSGSLLFGAKTTGQDGRYRDDDSESEWAPHACLLRAQ